MNELLFDLKLKQNPYKEELSSDYEIWGGITLKLNYQSKTIEILNHQWDLLEVYEWFQKSKTALLKESFPFHFENDKCIANCRDILYEKTDFKDLNEEIEYYDKIESYFSNHNFKLRGTNTPILFIGLKNNIGEISWSDSKTKEYKYFSFEMDYFINSTKDEMTKLLNKWHNGKENKNPKIIERIKEIEGNNNLLL